MTWAMLLGGGAKVVTWATLPPLSEDARGGPAEFVCIREGSAKTNGSYCGCCCKPLRHCHARASALWSIEGTVYLLEVQGGGGGALICRQ